MSILDLSKGGAQRNAKIQGYIDNLESILAKRTSTNYGDLRNGVLALVEAIDDELKKGIPLWPEWKNTLVSAGVGSDRTMITRFPYVTEQVLGYEPPTRRLSVAAALAGATAPHPHIRF